ncbi:GNAT family N-acetyltransferase [Almyronema epifaneia]|uniref:GNAT family N-acetyltransferase n=1 Tax=Almyronema epifaneia S1 TaxID=2991925 RepID=A0ABW6IEC9_9CYAN
MSTLQESLAVQQPVQLIRGQDNRIVEALLVDLAQSHLDAFDTLWRPLLQRFEAEDKFWDWVVKKRISLSSDNFESYAIEYKGVAQGLLAIETQWHRSWVTPRQQLVYVEAIASAPWNRTRIQQPPTFRGVGTLLLNFARRRSLQLGYGGRLGLHSLDSAQSFYDAKNMMEFGPDPEKDGLVYFEYSQLRESDR